jgi:hypothetical protein
MVASYSEGTGRFSAPKTTMARSFTMMDSPIVISSGGMCPVARSGRNAIFSMRAPRIHAAAIPRPRATPHGKWYTLRAK